jgi:hypothetical protein
LRAVSLNAIAIPDGGRFEAVVPRKAAQISATISRMDVEHKATVVVHGLDECSNSCAKPRRLWYEHKLELAALDQLRLWLKW